MKIIAKTQKGMEFLYNPKTARRVSEKSANKICAIVNEYKYLLGSGKNECWHVYDIDKYSTAYEYAQFQEFRIRNGIVTAVNR